MAPEEVKPVPKSTTGKNLPAKKNGNGKPRPADPAPPEPIFDPDGLFYKASGSPSKRHRIEKLRQIIRRPIETVDDVLEVLTWLIRALFTRQIDPKIATTIKGSCDAALQAIRTKGSAGGLSALRMSFGAKEPNGRTTVAKIELAGAKAKDVEKILSKLGPGAEPIVIPESDSSTQEPA